MENNEGFVNRYRDAVNKFYKLGAKQYILYKKIMGTKVIVERVKVDDSYREVFGSTFTTESMGNCGGR